MVKVKSSRSKRMSSSQRHKIERKKREHKRDLKKAAKALKKTGMGPSRSKKSRESAKLALKISNAHSDKEVILTKVLEGREAMRALKAERRARQGNQEEIEENDSAAPPEVVRGSSRRNLLFIAAKDSNNFAAQFERLLTELVFPVAGSDATSAETMEVPSAAFVITLDSRFAVQSIPWILMDAIVDQAATYNGGRKVLLLFTLTKADLVSAPALVTQMSLVAHALHRRYPQGLGSNLVAAVAPFSSQHDRVQTHYLRILHQFRQSPSCASKRMRSNLDGKICAIVVGLPNTGRRTLSRCLGSTANESSVSVVPLRAAQMQLIRSGLSEEEEQVHTKFAIPNAKSITVVQLPEDAALARELQHAIGSDVLFRSPMFVEKTPEPEPIGCVLFDSIVDKAAICQAFCLPAVETEGNSDRAKMKAGEKFLRDLGRCVTRHRGFNVSPLFSSNAGTMGKLSSSSLTANPNLTSGQQRSQATLLDSTYSNATPSKLVRISTVITKGKGRHATKSAGRDDGNALRLGARTFVREVCQSKHVPWAVMRAPGNVALTPAEVAKASEVFSVAISGGKVLASIEEGSGESHLSAMISALNVALKDMLVFLPNDVVEMDPDSIVAPQHVLMDTEKNEESGQEDQGSDEEDDEDEEGDDDGSSQEEDEEDSDDE